MPDVSKTASGFLTFTLHAHLPYVVNHGTWPHGMEWLHEAAAETYLPLLRILGNLERDGVPANFNLSLSPILLEQLSHPVFIAEFPRYVTRKILAAREDEAFFIQAGEAHLAETARYWARFFSTALDDFQALGGSIVTGFKRFNDAGVIDVITCGATHGYMPLLGTDESVRAQIRTAVDTHIRHFGKPPRGIWAPECGYRPAGPWTYPVPFRPLDSSTDSPAVQPAFERIGVEQAVSESSLDFFFVDTHLVEESERVASPYPMPDSSALIRPQREAPLRTSPRPRARANGPERSLYHPHYVDGTYGARGDAGKRLAATVFPRDPRTGVQVWSGETGYPGDANYLDFHKKRFPGGHRYWRVTGPHVDMADKQPYWPQQAAERVKAHAAHFVHLVGEALQPSLKDTVPPILCSPFDAELFGHWWFEGPMWLEAVCRAIHEQGSRLALTSGAQYLANYPRAGFISMHEGSWGAEGNNQVWLNPETSWTYTHIYPAEIYIRDLCSSGAWRESELGARIVKQLCRELLLLESSDWQFLITTGAARDYAEIRFLTHNDQFLELKGIWEAYVGDGVLNEHMTARLTENELRDGIFPDLDPAYWAAGAHRTRPEVAEIGAAGQSS